jgi:hypothetical protein
MYIMAVRTIGLSLCVQEGNSPDRQIRTLNFTSVGKEVEFLKQLGGWLRGSHPLKSASQLTSLEILRLRCNGAQGKFRSCGFLYIYM